MAASGYYIRIVSYGAVVFDSQGRSIQGFATENDAWEFLEDKEDEEA